MYSREHMNTFVSGMVDTPSDCFVTYEPNSSTLNIEVRSKVQSMYGTSINDLAYQVCSDLSVDSGQFIINDYGALPFVIQARIEAVVRQCNPKLQSRSLPDIKPHSLYPSSRKRFRRSRLYIPGNQSKLMLNAGIHKPDAIILDLEDSVALTEKPSARLIVRNALRTLNFFDAERMVRINQGDLGLTDLEEIIPHPVHLILVPKVEYADQLKLVDNKISELMHASGRTEPVFLMPILESARGILNALSIAEACPNTVALAIGLEDYTADIGTQRTVDGKESFFARSMIINAARATGMQAIDTVFSDVSDEVGLEQSVKEAKSLGFDGKGCIHPRQIRPIHEAFAPSPVEIDKAKRIMIAFEDAQKKGLGVVSLGSKMIDPPVVKRAETTIKLAIDTGLLDMDWND